MEQKDICLRSVYQVAGRGRSKVVLLVDDHEEDRIFFERAALAAISRIMLVHAQNGAEIFGFLDRCLQTNSLPDLVVLDLKLPEISGLEILKVIRDEARMKNVRVVVLTSSPQDTDREKALKLGANGYFVKPADASEYTRIIENAFGVPVEAWS